MAEEKQTTWPLGRVSEAGCAAGLPLRQGPPTGVLCVDVGRVKRRAGVEAHRVAVLREDAVENEGVNMYVEIERTPKSLNDRHRATAPIPHAIMARSPAEEAENRSHGSPHHGAAERVIPGQPVPQSRW